MAGEDHTTGLEVKLVSLQEQVKQLQRDLEDEKVPYGCYNMHNTYSTVLALTVPYIHYNSCSTQSVTCKLQ